MTHDLHSTESKQAIWKHCTVNEKVGIPSAEKQLHIVLMTDLDLLQLHSILSTKGL